MNDYQQIENYKFTENISVTKRIHPVWLDWRMMQEMKPSPLTLHRNTPILGKYHYIYTSKKGEISLVEMPNYFLDGIDLWEIMQIGNTDLDCDEERFRSKEEAEKRIKEILD
ncbi:hypothetical protein [Serratia sp. (in: enterobacteria)]|uniref:hypothetical protein n=1 Tax=Serratia sp. (in: enterobacteria) TaxID=616 RepID=UPI003989F954